MMAAEPDLPEFKSRPHHLSAVGFGEGLLHLYELQVLTVKNKYEWFLPQKHVRNHRALSLEQNRLLSSASKCGGLCLGLEREGLGQMESKEAVFIGGKRMK